MGQVLQGTYALPTVLQRERVSLFSTDPGGQQLPGRCLHVAPLWRKSRSGAGACQDVDHFAGVPSRETARAASRVDLVRHRLHGPRGARSEEHTSELQSLMRNSYAVFCLKKKTIQTQTTN